MKTEDTQHFIISKSAYIVALENDKINVRHGDTLSDKGDCIMLHDGKLLYNDKTYRPRRVFAGAAFLSLEEC